MLDQENLSAAQKVELMADQDAFMAEEAKLDTEYNVEQKNHETWRAKKVQ